MLEFWPEWHLHLRDIKACKTEPEAEILLCLPLDYAICLLQILAVDHLSHIVILKISKLELSGTDFARPSQNTPCPDYTVILFHFLPHILALHMKKVQSLQTTLVAMGFINTIHHDFIIKAALS